MRAPAPPDRRRPTSVADACENEGDLIPLPLTRPPPMSEVPPVYHVSPAASPAPRESHYSHHVFFCTNVRTPDGSGQTRPSCGLRNADALRDHAKKRVKQLGLAGPGKVRINNAGCLDRCEEGPCVVVYPEAVWYTYFDEQDIDEIVDRHLAQGEVVERLRI